MLSKEELYSPKVLKIIEEADLNIPYAQEQLLELFESGLTSEQHNEVRKHVYIIKANQGDSVAQYWLGFIYSMIDKDAEKALDWLERSANQGNAEAMYELAMRYGDFINTPSSTSIVAGVGFGYNSEKEYYWLSKGAEAGSSKCQLGFADVLKNNEEYDLAIFWYIQASQCNEINIKIKAYYELSLIYGNSSISTHYNQNKQIECLINVLCMKQNYPFSTEAYDEFRYESAAFSLGIIYKNIFKRTGDELILKQAVYCFYIAASRGNNIAKSEHESLPYNLSKEEQQIWYQDAQSMNFNLPIMSNKPDKENVSSINIKNDSSYKNNKKIYNLYFSLFVVAILYILVIFRPFSNLNINKPNEEDYEVIQTTEQENEYGWENSDDLTSTNENEFYDPVYEYNIPSNIDRPYEFCDYKPVIVDVDGNLIMRSGNSTECERVGSIANKSLIYIIGLSKQPGWSLVYYRYYDEYGWVDNDYLKAIDEAETSDIEENYVQVDGKNYRIDGGCPLEDEVAPEVGLVLRNGPSSDSRWILRMEYGDDIIDLCRYSDDPDWAYVEYNDGVKKYYGFANANYFVSSQESY